jgi:hypothetical protein
MIKPIVCYASEVWGYEYSDSIESVQSKFCKHFLGVNNSVNNCFAVWECGRLPLCVTVHTNCIIRYWCRLVMMQAHMYPKQCYRMLKGLDDGWRVTWATNVTDMLFKNGFGFVWLSQEVGDVNALIFQFRQRLTDCMRHDWHDRVNT